MDRAARHRIACPSCSGEIPLASPAAVVASCPYCASAIVVNEEAARLLGKMSLLAETPSCLAVGWTARCLGREVVTLGRVQYRYGAGLWDEWWVQFLDDHRQAWISQDEGEYMLEHPVDAPPEARFDAARPGDEMLLGGARFWVEEKNEARLVGVQGQLPFPVVPDERVRYLDLSDGRAKATIEFFDDGETTAFRGRYLGPGELEARL